jgi:hypothetical protein
VIGNRAEVNLHHRSTRRTRRRDRGQVPLSEKAISDGRRVNTVDGALDARTWITIGGVIVGFFLVPFGMLVYDRRRQGRLEQSETSTASPPHRHRRSVRR